MTGHRPASHGKIGSGLAPRLVAVRTVVAYSVVSMSTPGRESFRRPFFCGTDVVGRRFVFLGSCHLSIQRRVIHRDSDGQEDVLVIDLLSLKHGLALPRSLSAILNKPFGSPDVLKLGGVGAAILYSTAVGDHLSLIHI